MKPENQKALVKGFKQLLSWALVLVVIPLTLLASCQSKLIYFPRPYGIHTTRQWEHATSGKPVAFQTTQGRQRAFLQGNLTSPRNLWIVCGGNGSLGLDWSEWLVKHGPGQDAYLLVDFPGYGDCAGKPSPRTIRESLRTVVPAATQALGWPGAPDPTRLRIFGHSLGAGACLMAASEFGIQRGVLLTPFTSTMDMSRAITGLPIGFIVWHRFDNSARLAEMASRGPAKVSVFHGTQDEAIPFSMSRQLAAEQPRIVQLHEIPHGRHNTLAESHAPEIAAAMSEIGNLPL